jgi:hypothetical protein
MKKSDLLAAVEAKIGFHSIIEDSVAPDNKPGDQIEKRYLYINHINADGTAGKTFVYYLHETATDDAWFYNVEVEAVDSKEPSSDQKKLDALQAYLATTFDAYFVLKVDIKNNWAEAETFKLNAGALDRKNVLVFKKGNNPITHLIINE